MHCRDRSQLLAVLLLNGMLMYNACLGTGMNVVLTEQAKWSC